MLKRAFLASLIAALPAAARAWETLSGDSSIKEARLVAVLASADWETLWARHAEDRKEAMPPVDFEKESVVAVFLGEKPTAGWTIELDVKLIPGAPGQALATWRAVPPPEGGFTAQVVTHPFLMKKVSRLLGVTFQLATEAPSSSAPSGFGPAVKSRVHNFLFGNEWYASWGYNTEQYAPFDIRVSQPSLGNDFTVHGLQGHDEPPYGKENPVSTFPQFSVPQYNIRVGRFVDKKRTLAIELNYDHTKYSSTLGQTARVTGTIGGKPVDQDQVLSPDYFRYYLHNGANHVMVNVVKRMPLLGRTNETMSVSGIAKAGVGVMIPHPENTVFGQDSDVGEKKFGNLFGVHRGWWQFDGITTGLEAGVRWVPVRPFFVEVTDKVAYARLFDVPVYQGTATHDLWMNEVVVSLGFTVNGGGKRKK